MEDGEGRQLTARAGDIIGSLGMLSGQPLGRSANVLRSGLALRIDRDDLFDLLGQRPELMRQLFEGMFAVGRTPTVGRGVPQSAEPDAIRRWAACAIWRTASTM